MKLCILMILQLGEPPHPPPSMIPDFWQMLALALPVMLAVFAIGVFAHAVYEHHTQRRRNR